MHESQADVEALEKAFHASVRERASMAPCPLALIDQLVQELAVLSARQELKPWALAAMQRALGRLRADFSPPS